MRLAFRSFNAALPAPRFCGKGIIDLMSEPTSSSQHAAWPRRFSQFTFFLLVSVPFLVPWHTSPIPTFYSEWAALALGLVASLVLVTARSLPITGATLLGLFLAGLSGLQIVLGQTALPQIASIYALYLLWAAILASASRHWADSIGHAQAVGVLAKGILLGSMLAALLSLLQPWLATFGWTGFAAGQGGPLGQANHFTSHLWLGLVAVLYLRMSLRLLPTAFWMAVVVLTFTAAVAGQRSSFLYAVALVAIAFWSPHQMTSSEAPNPRRLALGIGLVFLFMQPLATLVPDWYSDGSKPPAALRAVQQVGGPSIRLQLWRVGWAGIASAPLLGNGIGSYPGLALAHADTIPPEANPGPAESAHNLPIDLAVEYGIPVAVLVLLAAGWWLQSLRHGLQDATTLWAIGTMAILGLHSLIEYPLMHAYFLGLLAVVAGVFGSAWRLGRRLAPVALTIGLVLWGGVMLAEVRRDYRWLETALALGEQPATLSLAQANLLRISSSSLMSPWVNTTACVSIDPLAVSLHDGLAVCSVAMHFAPTVETGINASILHWRYGNPLKAQKIFENLEVASKQYGSQVFKDSLLAALKRTEDSPNKKGPEFRAFLRNMKYEIN